ncbi:MAG TPA: polyprenyl diphosphate synthase [Streptosporangiaceae bacterium]|nr:polyprenyl diphosphate synthase [Streptosporangiaceae bacterium]
MRGPLRTLRAPARRFAVRLYERRLRRQLAGRPLPRHVGLIIDGNRRWAKEEGLASPSEGHRHGAERIWDALTWCRAAGIRHVTVFVCSAENLARRDDAEVAALMEIIEHRVVTRILAADPGWQVHIAGLVDMLPDSTSRALKQAADTTSASEADAHVTLCVGYGGRQEIAEAVRSLLLERAATGSGLAELAAAVTEDDIARHLTGDGQPEPDLIIRTSGEQRMSNFLIWQSTGAYLHFCDCYWPAFGEIDFLRALRDFAARAADPPDLW